MPCQTLARLLNHCHDLLRHILPSRTQACNLLNLLFAKIATPPHCKPNKTKLKTQILMDTLEGIGRYVTFPILNLGIRRGIQTIFTNLFEQCYIPLMPIYACMQQVHLITIMYRTLLLLNKRKSIDHQNPQGHEFPKGACLISSYKGIDNP